MDRVLKGRSQASAVRKNPCLTLVGSKLYDQRHETGDIKFIIESEEIPAHRCVLAALSPKYKAQFYGAMPEKDTINVVDVSSAAFKEFLQFFYLDEVTLTLGNFKDVLDLAKQSLVDELVTECINFLFDVIGVDKLIWYYRLAIDYEIESLKEFCLKQIGGNIKSVFKTPDFLSCDQEMLCQILDIDSMNCNESDVFKGCIAWAQVKCEDEGIDTAHTVNLRAALGDAIFKIRFCSMTAEQFAAIEKGCTGFLSAQELIEVYRTIALKVNGEISGVFGADNSKPRNSIQYLECSFSNGLRKSHDNAINFDGIKFSCNKEIHLNGFVICDSMNYDVVVKVEVANVLQKFDFTKAVLDNETKITFANPIHIKANKSCYIEIQTMYQLFQHGVHTESDVELGDISFKFVKIISDTCSITRLLFNTID